MHRSTGSSSHLSLISGGGWGGGGAGRKGGGRLWEGGRRGVGSFIYFFHHIRITLGGKIKDKYTSIQNYRLKIITIMKWGSQGGGKWEKKGKIMQHCAMFCNRKNAKRREPTIIGLELGLSLKGTRSGRFKPPCPPSLS